MLQTRVGLLGVSSAGSEALSALLALLGWAPPAMQPLLGGRVRPLPAQLAHSKDRLEHRREGGARGAGCGSRGEEPLKPSAWGQLLKYGSQCKEKIRDVTENQIKLNF